MPAEQFSAPVRGAAGTPLQTTEAGSIQTDNYDYGGSFGTDGSDYPVEVDPDRIVQELMLTEADDVVMHVETIHGDTFEVDIKSTVGRWQIWEMQTVEFHDPNDTGAPLYGAWAGE